MVYTQIIYLYDQQELIGSLVDWRDRDHLLKSDCRPCGGNVYDNACLLLKIFPSFLTGSLLVLYSSYRTVT
jgi:hypothetical protein